MDIDKIFGVLSLEEETPKEIIKLAEEREKARKGKNWKLSDELRNKIKNKGYLIEDSSSGYVIKKI